jgi:hypothetical protein
MHGDGKVKPCRHALLPTLNPQGGTCGSGKGMGAVGEGGPPALFNSHSRHGFQERKCMGPATILNREGYRDVGATVDSSDGLCRSPIGQELAIFCF